MTLIQKARSLEDILNKGLENQEYEVFANYENLSDQDGLLLITYSGNLEISLIYSCLMMIMKNKIMQGVSYELMREDNLI